jgi:hypothetical protein
VIRAQAGANAGLSNVIDFSVHSHWLRAFWKFDESSGAAMDTSPSNPPNHGTLLNGATRVQSFDYVNTNPPTPDNALRLDGVDDYVSVPDSQTNLSFGGAQFSVAAWVKFEGATLANEANVYPILAKWAAAGTGFEFAIKGGTAKGLSFRTLSNGVAAQEIVPVNDQRAVLLDGFPHHVAFTRDASNVGRLYIDGALVSATLSMPGSLTTTAALFLGKNNASPTNAYYKGLLEDVKLFSSTLRADEIQSAVSADGDPLPDWWELEYFGNLSKAANGDDDTGGPDGLTNLQEYERGTNPAVADTDGDGFHDGTEVNNGQNPLVLPTNDSAGTIVQLKVFTRLE